jgi:tetratricopeptide (TPR) repeat protein
MRLDPKDSFSYQNLANAYERLNRFDEARAVAEKAAAQQRSVHFTLYELAFIRGDEAAERHELELASGQRDEPIVLWMRTRGECALGRLQSMQAAYAQSVSASQRLGYKEPGFLCCLERRRPGCIHLETGESRVRDIEVEREPAFPAFRKLA